MQAHDINIMNWKDSCRHVVHFTIEMKTYYNSIADSVYGDVAYKVLIS